jgi:hypothetical protein
MRRGELLFKRLAGRLLPESGPAYPGGDNADREKDGQPCDAAQRRQ